MKIIREPVDLDGADLRAKLFIRIRIKRPFGMREWRLKAGRMLIRFAGWVMRVQTQLVVVEGEVRGSGSEKDGTE